ncbi:hypothetical protein VSDG_05212 [Cytospora chrysosperma]|uniref:Structure-specific endonuclease subunit SLX4 n=1 Tax=Cytospora chrysosperma TaxID=252740 RepID=A0A423VY37_CYTCH|nr:hypothetical protein VSDG_05212 [Valsa sordida]
MLHDRIMMLSSSPDLPDLKDLVVKKPRIPALRSGSAAAPIPANATKAFTTAADLLRTAHANDDDTLDTIDEPERPPARKSPAKRAARKPTKAPAHVAKEVVVLSSDGVAPQGDDSNTENREMGEYKLDGNTLVEKPWKKFKTPAEIGDAEGEASAQAAVAVQDVKPPPKTRAQRKKTSKPETVSKHFTQKPAGQEKAAKASTPEPLNLEPAVQRRTDWTPPRADTTPEEIDHSDVSMVLSQVREGEIATDKIEIFKNLRDAYGHKATDVKPASTKQQAANVLGKRKIIDMVSVDRSSRMTDDLRSPSPVKEKAPKKKPRTITDLATAAYMPKAAELEEELRNEDSIFDYFIVNKEGQGASTTTASEAKGKGKASKVVKGTKKKVPSKQAILLSPEAAIRQSAGQDFVFGTSSQLAREQSPSFLRDLQEALRASNIAKEDDFLAITSGQAGSKKPSRDLWSVSARDEAGELVDVQSIDLADSSAFLNDDSIAILNPWKDLPLEPAEVETADSSLVEIGSRPVPTNEGESSQSPIPKSHSFLSKHKITVNSATATSLESSARPSFSLISDLLEDEPPPPSNQQQSQEEVRAISSTTTANPIQKPRPKYELFTDAKLAKEVSSYGFKAIKTRSAMIALLDQCWKSPATPVKKRGRPRKDAVTTVEATVSSTPSPPKARPLPSTPKRKKAATRPTSVAAESDVDSEASLTSPEQVFSSPLAVDVSLSEDTEISLTLSPTAQQSALFSHITKAITSAPRTTDPEDPSWHEKMLMYDPVILEDLTAWLNSGQLTQVGYDGEVAPADVKKWCESRSVCCLWRVSYRGRERKRV